MKQTNTPDSCIDEDCFICQRSEKQEDEKGSGGFWDLAGELVDTDPSYQQEAIYNALIEVKQKCLQQVEKSIADNINVDDYVKRVKGWNRQSYDKPYDDGFNQAKEEIRQNITNNV